MIWEGAPGVALLICGGGGGGGHKFNFVHLIHIKPLK